MGIKSNTPRPRPEPSNVQPTPRPAARPGSSPPPTDEGEARPNVGSSTSDTGPGRASPLAAGPLGGRLVELTGSLRNLQYQLVTVAAEFADSAEWVAAGASSAGAWLAQVADVEACTAREWIRIGRLVRNLPTIAADFAGGTLSYSKVRTLTRVATPETEAELAGIARPVPASGLGRVLAAWMAKTFSGEELDDYHQQQRSVRWRTDPDGMLTVTCRLPPGLGVVFTTTMARLMLKSEPRRNRSGDWPTVAQQRADVLDDLVRGTGRVDTEIVLHVRGDGVSCDDGTPITETVIAELAPTAFLRALVHDAEGRPINASNRRRHPTARQKRVVDARDGACVDCGRTDLLQYDHNPPYHQSGQTRTDELELRCAPCHQRRHREPMSA